MESKEELKIDSTIEKDQQADGGNQEENPVGKISKSQLKKQMKQKQWEEKRLLQKQKNKEKYKKSPKSFTHLTRFNQVTENADSAEHKPNLTKQQKQQLFRDLCLQGPKYVIDCDFDDYMQDRELKSLGQQLAYCHSTNKQLEKPLNVYFTGVGERLQKILEVSHCQNWAVQIHYKQTYLDVIEDKDKLVYLTADSDNLLEELDDQMVYIIGGIVDHNRYKLLTFNKAKEQGIKHARLPIRENIELDTSAVLTVNHVFDIIANYIKTHDWKVTLENAIPARKIKQQQQQATIVLGKDRNKDEEQKKDDGEVDKEEEFKE